VKPTNAWQSAHAKATTIPLLYTREAKKKMVRELLAALREALK